MDVDVTALTFRYPDRAARAAASQPLSKKPAARIIASCDDTQDRVLFVPVRVARHVEQDAPELPLAYASLRERVFAAEDALCYAVLIEMLERRDHSVAEARRKLDVAGYRSDTIEHAIARAQEARFLEDARFARTFIEERIRRGWGRIKIEHELARRGIRSSDLPGYPEAFFSVDDDLERAGAILARKSVPRERAYEKFVRHLRSKGFTYDIAMRAARRRLEEDA